MHRLGQVSIQDHVWWAYLAAGLLVIAQALTHPGEGIVRAGLPYLVAWAAFVVVRVGRPIGRMPLGILVVALGATLIASWAIIRFLVALPSGLNTPSGFYLVKVQVTTPLGDHNTAAGLLILGVVATAALAARDPRWHLGLIVCTAGMVATLSRGAMVVLLVAGATAWFLASSRRVAGRILGAGATGLGAVVVAALLLDSSPPATGAPDPVGAFGASLVGRADLMVRGIEVAGDHLALGAGLGQFRTFAADLPLPNDHAHQLVVHAAAEGGIVLATIVVALTCTLVVRAWRLPPSLLRDVTLLGAIGLVAHAQVDVLGGRLGYEMAIAVLLGLVSLVGPASGRAAADGA